MKQRHHTLNVTSKLTLGFLSLLLFLLQSSAAFAGGSKVSVKGMGGGGLLKSGLNFIDQILQLLQGPVAVAIVVIAICAVVFRNWGGQGGGWASDGLKIVLPALIIGNLGTILSAVGLTSGALLYL